MDPIPDLIEKVSKENLTTHLFALSADPLPCRQLNYTLPGHEKCTLYEADDFIAGKLSEWGYTVEKEAVSVQALRRDTSKTMPHQFIKPEPEDPWYTAYNLYAKKTGVSRPDEFIVVISHKDSQSWIEISPGAKDNAVGTVGNMEIARILSTYPSHRSIWFVFCNEEHVPWTSYTVADNMVKAGLNVIAVLNIDGISGKSEEDIIAGRKTNKTRYTTPEGEKLAELMGILNEQYRIGLIQEKFRSEHPNDDDGSFIKAGIPAAVLNIGSFPYADPAYHSLGDTPDKVDIENVYMATQLSMAFVVYQDNRNI